MVVSFIQNITLLVSATVIYTIIIRRWEKGSIFYALLSGLLFGVVAVLGMRMPVLLEPGVIFDGRTIIHSIAGLFGGPYTALVAAVIGIGYRAFIGGSGAVVGIFTIIQSSLFGVIYFYLVKRKIASISVLNLLIFSAIVHLVMLYSFQYIPSLSLSAVVNQLALPILLLYPLTTLVLAYIIKSQENQLQTERDLQENERRLKKTQEIAHVGSWDYDLSTGQLSWSDEVYRIFGLDKEAFSPSYDSFLQFIHPDDRDTVDRAYKDSIITGKDSYEVEHRVVPQANGEVRYVLERCEHFKNSAGEIVYSIGMVQDITERKGYENRLSYMSLHDQLTGLYNRYYFEDELNRLTNSRYYPISLISADLDGLKLINDTMGHNQGDQVLIDCANILKESLRQGDVLARIGGDEFAAILLETDGSTGEQICNRIRSGLFTVNQASLELPLSLSLGLATSKNPTDGSLYDLLKKADDLMYRDKLSHRKSSRNQIVQALMSALAERDFIAEGHADRVQHLSNKMGVRLGLNANQLGDLSLLAQVHDLGKVGIPDQILFKPGPLNEEEWEIMKMHPEKGYRIASSSPDLSTVAELILKHHEHWNGGGYPLGLKGDSIPVECRILSIVDAFDAMTNDRPYSKARTDDEAISELKRFAGKQFDPELVEVFVTVLE